MKRMKSKWLLVMTVILGLLLLTACGSKDGNDGNKNTSAGQSDALEVDKVTVAEPNRVLAFTPIYVALSKGFFEEEGVEVELVSVGGGTQTLATLLSGDAQFTAATPITFFTLLENNRDILAVSSFNKGLPFQTVLSTQFMEKHGLSTDMPLQDKIEAMKGATFGAIVLGSAQEIYLKSKVMQGGLSPNDVEVTAIGNTGAILAAMQEGVIDGTISSPPLSQQAEANNIGKMWLDGSDFEAFDGMDSQWLFGIREWVEAHPNTTKAMVKALARGIAYASENPEDTAVAIQPFFEGVDVKILEQSLKDISYAFQGDGSMTEESWSKALKPLRDLSEVSKITQDFDIKENGFWTNNYISK